MRTTLKINNEKPDDSLYIIECKHSELGDITVALLDQFTKGPEYSMLLATLMTAMPPAKLAEFFTHFKEALPPTKAASPIFTLLRDIYMHRAELCALLPPDYEPSKDTQR